MTFIDCTFEGNTNYQRGAGAIYFSQNCNPSFTNCNFINNYLKVDYHDDDTTGGAAIRFEGSTNGVKFLNCIFDSNYAHSPENHARVYGGAIIFQGKAENTEFIDCTFINNKCRAGIENGNNGHNGRPTGAGIYFRGGSSHILIDNCNFTNNTLIGKMKTGEYDAYAYGGAICFGGTTEYIPWAPPLKVFSSTGNT